MFMLVFSCLFIMVKDTRQGNVLLANKEPRTKVKTARVNSSEFHVSFGASLLKAVLERDIRTMERRERIVLCLC